MSSFIEITKYLELFFRVEFLYSKFIKSLLISIISKPSKSSTEAKINISLISRPKHQAFPTKAQPKVPGRPKNGTNLVISLSSNCLVLSITISQENTSKIFDSKSTSWLFREFFIIIQSNSSKAKSIFVHAPINSYLILFCLAKLIISLSLSISSKFLISKKYLEKLLVLNDDKLVRFLFVSKYCILFYIKSRIYSF
jgi:hypothetical protein